MLARVLERYPRDGFTETLVAALTAPEGSGTRANTMAKLGADRLVRRNPLDRAASSRQVGLPAY